MWRTSPLVFCFLLAGWIVFDRATAQLAVIEVRYNGIEFIATSEVTTRVIGGIIEADEQRIPEGTRFTFEGYPGGSDRATLQIYPAERYSDQTGYDISALIDGFNAALAGSLNLTETTLLPFQPEFIVETAQITSLLTPGEVGGAFRAVVRTPEKNANGDDLFYIVVNLTQHWSLVFGSFAITLPDTTALNDTSNGDFTPSLDSLDSIFLSMTAEPAEPEVVSASNVTITLNPHLGFRLASAGMVPPSNEALPLPEHVEFRFEPSIQSMNGGLINIYSTADYEETTGISLQGLRAALETRPTNPIPYLHPSTARSIWQLMVQPAYVDFASGSGVRYVVSYSIDMRIPSHKLYTFYGLSNDGDNFIEAWLPTGETLLFNAPEMQTYENRSDEALAKVRSEYYDAAADLLNTAHPQDFQPPLDLIDRMVASIAIGDD